MVFDLPRCSTQCQVVQEMVVVGAPPVERQEEVAVGAAAESAGQ